MLQFHNNFVDSSNNVACNLRRKRRKDSYISSSVVRYLDDRSARHGEDNVGKTGAMRRYDQYSLVEHDHGVVECGRRTVSEQRESQSKVGGSALYDLFDLRSAVQSSVMSSPAHHHDSISLHAWNKMMSDVAAEGARRKLHVDRTRPEALGEARYVGDTGTEVPSDRPVCCVSDAERS